MILVAQKDTTVLNNTLQLTTAGQTIMDTVLAVSSMHQHTISKF